MTMVLRCSSRGTLDEGRKRVPAEPDRREEGWTVKH